MEETIQFIAIVALSILALVVLIIIGHSLWYIYGQWYRQRKSDPKENCNKPY